MMKFFLKSHSCDNLLLFFISLCLFVFPFLLFRPVVKTPSVSRVPQKHTAILAELSPNSKPILNYWLFYHNPKDFLFADDSKSFAFFRTFDKESADALPKLNFASPAFPVPSLPRTEEMTSLPLPAKTLLFDEPLFPTKKLIEVPPPASPFGEYPVLHTDSGVLLPFHTEDFTDSDILSLNPERPSLFRIHFPVAHDLPAFAELLESCGVRRLDSAAIRTLNKKLLSGDFRKQLGGGHVTIYWLSRVNVSETPDTMKESEI